MRTSELMIGAMVLLSFMISIAVYPSMPAQMATHWNAEGEVDGSMPRFWGLFLLPFIFAGLALLFLAIPRIDPLQANIEQFRRYYDGFVILFFIFLLSIYTHTILWNTGIEISPNITFPIGVGILLYYSGILLEHAKRNWFIGIRTPWTLSNDRVWERTHQRGAKLFKLAGIIAVAGVFFERYALFFVLVPVILVALYTISYSYFVYQKELGNRIEDARKG
ncbi:MAG: SdpI family protein [Methanophagales archaeon ANME-1-THS]|nr:MAG: SdpI family protein [Methanophagales archaeon ANME-1-THS]